MVIAVGKRALQALARFCRHIPWSRRTRRHTQPAPPAAARRAPRLAILYHFMYPDDVISAHHLSELAAGLAARGWAVEARPANRQRHRPRRALPRHERHNGVLYRRVWRPGFDQHAALGRLVNSAWMILAWAGLRFRPTGQRPDVILIGTDPMFAALTALPLSWGRPGWRLVHWCFDLHPEAAAANELVRPESRLFRLMQAAIGRAYGRFDLIADLGACMRARLRRYAHGAHEATMPPWALTESDGPVEPDPATREALFGQATIGVLYSGNLGQAHTYKAILDLARRLRDNAEIHFCFAARGKHADSLKAAVGPDDTNISFAGFAPAAELAKRLGAADIHLASLAEAFSGIAVPSKFQGSLAAGRPVVFAGPRDSAVATWITAYGVGWVLDAASLDDVARALAGYAAAPRTLRGLWAKCYATYRDQFSRRQALDAWDAALSYQVRAAPADPAPAEHA